MLQLQRLQPEIKRLQAEHKGDRQKLNEEMMALYKENKINPLAGCLPLLLQAPVFFILYRVLHGLTQLSSPTARSADVPATSVGARSGLLPGLLKQSSELFQSLVGKTEMMAFGLDLSEAGRPSSCRRELRQGPPLPDPRAGRRRPSYYQQRQISSRDEGQTSTRSSR